MTPLPKSFWVWAAWKDANARCKRAGVAPRMRPAGLPTRIPATWWARYAIHVGGLHPKPNPIIPPQIVPHVGRAALVQRVIYAAQNPLAAIGAPPGTIVALTADPNPAYACYATASTVAALRSAGLAVTSWGNQFQIGPERIRALHAELGLDGEPIFQFETEDEARSMLSDGATLAVGNGNGCTEGTKAAMNERIDAGELACSQESYRNVTGGPWPAETSAGGVKTASITVGLYDGSAENPGVGSYISLEELRGHATPEQWRDISAYHAAGNKGSWAAFPHA